MERGGAVANPNRYDRTILPDGSQAEDLPTSATTTRSPAWARKPSAWSTTTSRPRTKLLTESGIKPSRIQCQVSGFERRIIPPGCKVVTQGIDVNKRYCHWVVREVETRRRRRVGHRFHDRLRDHGGQGDDPRQRRGP